MKNLSFVLWVLLWPLVIDISNRLNGFTANDMTNAELWFVVVVWVVVGGMVYEGDNNIIKRKDINNE